MKEIKEFIERMEEVNSRGAMSTAQLFGEPKFQALKALTDKSISKMEVTDHIGGGNKVVEEKKGKWIKWNGGNPPFRDETTLVDVKLRGDHKAQPIYLNCDPDTVYWNHPSYYLNVIAYRVAQSTEEINYYAFGDSAEIGAERVEKKEAEYNAAYETFSNSNYCQCDNPIFYARQSELPHGAFYTCCVKCQKQPNPSKKEPKKQTLLEFIKNHLASNNKMLIMSDIDLISEYLELNKN